MKISLLGFMASGKSTVGQLLASRLGLQFLETDLIIEEREGRSIEQIFTQSGEKYFRLQEKEVLKKLVYNKNSFVLSTGGGIVLDTENRKLLKEETVPILLDVSAETVYQRIQDDNSSPLLKSENPFARIKSLMQQRKKYYQQFSLKIETDGKTPPGIVDEILEKIGVD